MSEYVTIGYEYLHETHDAVKIFDGDTERWVPKNVIKDGKDMDFANEYKMEIEEWFAIQERII